MSFTAPTLTALLTPSASIVRAGIIGLLLAGCSQTTLKEGFAPVHGIVTLDGAPLPNAEIVFETGKGRSIGRTDSNGAYHAEYSRTLHGAGTGPAKVKISTKVIFADENVADFDFNTQTGEHSKPELVPANYNTKSTLTIDITETGAPYNFDLVTK